MVHQVFVIHRHGARYSLAKPVHNAVWPKNSDYWKKHIGKLTPIGVHQLTQLGEYFRIMYPWVTRERVRVQSTCKSRAIESAWSLLLGLLPEEGVHICEKNERCEKLNNCDHAPDAVCIEFFAKHDYDKVFGKFENNGLGNGKKNAPNNNSLNNSSNISVDKERTEILKRLGWNGRNTDKLKQIYSQLKIDEQLGLTKHSGLCKKYNLTETDLQVIERTGLDVIVRRHVPCSDSTEDPCFSGSQGAGLLKYISDEIKRMDQSLSVNEKENDKKENKRKTNKKLNLQNAQKEFHILSCHDSNIMAVMAQLGLKINSPGFAGYILVDRRDDIVNFYFCEKPFGKDAQQCIKSRVWPCRGNRDKYLVYDEMPEGTFHKDQFLQTIDTAIKN